MKLLLCFALLFVAVTAQLTVETVKEEESPFLGEIEDLDGGFDGEMETTMTTDDDDDEDGDDEEDDVPTTPSMPKHQCKEKFYQCKSSVSIFNCSGMVKCFEEKSQCYQTYRANNPNLPTKSPEKMACKKQFESCTLKDWGCMGKLICYKRKQVCYMRAKRFGMGLPRHGSHHLRHRFHKRKPCPCKMKCKRQWKYCVKKAKTCKEKLKCYWEGYKCMKKCKKYRPTKPAYKIYNRRWNPEIMAKCKEGFNQCLNTTNSTCPKEIGCFISMKNCIMDGHRPTPCPKMMKCKTEFYNCTENASSTCEQIECMKSKHECFENIRPTKPPTGDDDDDDDDEEDDDDVDVKMGYKPRKRWGGKWAQKRKCMKMAYEQCLKSDKTCTEKMSCYMEMKKNKCMSGAKHAVHKAVKDFTTKIKKHFHGLYHRFMSMAKPMMMRYRKGGKSIINKYGNTGRPMMKNQNRGKFMMNNRNRGKSMMNKFQKRVDKMRGFFKKSKDGMKKKFKSMKDRWGKMKPSYG